MDFIFLILILFLTKIVPSNEKKYNEKISTKTDNLILEFDVEHDFVPINTLNYKFYYDLDNEPLMEFKKLLFYLTIYPWNRIAKIEEFEEILLDENERVYNRYLGRDLFQIAKQHESDIPYAINRAVYTIKKTFTKSNSTGNVKIPVSQFLKVVNNKLNSKIEGQFKSERRKIFFEVSFREQGFYTRILKQESQEPTTEIETTTSLFRPFKEPYALILIVPTVLYTILTIHMTIMKVLHKILIDFMYMIIPEKGLVCWEHPAGPQTIFFWAPLIKWGLVLGALGDLARPEELLELWGYLALTLTGVIWARYSVVIIPVNWSLFSVNILVAITNSAQVIRCIHYRATHGKPIFA